MMHFIWADLASSVTVGTKTGFETGSSTAEPAKKKEKRDNTPPLFSAKETYINESESWKTRTSVTQSLPL